jgi:DNA-binding CsgD family transcriptional regulator
VFIICEKKTGAPRFSVEVKGDEHSAIVRSASLLALACSMRGDSPADYAIRIPAHDELTRRVTCQAEELLRLGRGFSSSVPLSPRENEVLLDLLRNRVNKEIADHLHISVRTVKFHVSSLLAKFGVQSRWDLIQKAGEILGVRAPAETSQPSPSPAQKQQPRAAEARAVAKPLCASAQTRVIPFRRSSLPA